MTGNAIVGTGTGLETGLSYVKGQAVNTTGQSPRGAGLAARQCELAVRA